MIIPWRAAACIALSMVLSVGFTLRCTAAPGQNLAALPVATGFRACLDALGTPARAGSTALPNPLRVRSWNVMKLRGEGVDQEVLDLGNNTQILLLQESLQNLAGSPGFTRYFSPGYRQGTIQTGVEIRSRTPADLQCQLQYHEPWLRTPKAVSIVRLPFAAQALLVANLHAINFTLGSREYREQLDAIGRLVDAHRGPALVGGDFNYWNPWRVSVVAEFASRYDLHEVRFQPDWRSLHLGSPVDTLFVRGLRMISAGAMPTGASDHHPISASLVLQPAADSPVARPAPVPTR